jgi:hypothetical protein
MRRRAPSLARQTGDARRHGRDAQSSGAPLPLRSYLVQNRSRFPGGKQSAFGRMAGIASVLGEVPQCPARRSRNQSRGGRLRAAGPIDLRRAGCRDRPRTIECPSARAAHRGDRGAGDPVESAILGRRIRIDEQCPGRLNPSGCRLAGIGRDRGQEPARVRENGVNIGLCSRNCANWRIFRAALDKESIRPAVPRTILSGRASLLKYSAAVQAVPFY